MRDIYRASQICIFPACQTCPPSISIEQETRVFGTPNFHPMSELKSLSTRKEPRKGEWHPQGLPGDWGGEVSSRQPQMIPTAGGGSSTQPQRTHPRHSTHNHAGSSSPQNVGSTSSHIQVHDKDREIEFSEEGLCLSKPSAEKGSAPSPVWNASVSSVPQGHNLADKYPERPAREDLLLACCPHQ